MIKNITIGFFQRLFGLSNYLFIFSLLRIITIRIDRKRKTFIFFCSGLRKNSNLLVIGACTGITTVPLAKQVSEGFVFAFEPANRNYQVLQKIFQYFKLKNVAGFKLALGNINGETAFIYPISYKAYKQGLAHVKHPSMELHNKGIVETVPVSRLDDIENLKHTSIDGIKLVAENYESFIIEGAKEIITKNKPVIYCELWYNKNRERVFELMKEMDYKIYVLRENKLILHQPGTHMDRALIFKHGSL